MSATNRGAERRADDFYATPGWVTRAILPHLQSRGLLGSDKLVLEPAAGDGAISRELLMCMNSSNLFRVEIDPARAKVSCSRCADFLSIGFDHKFDLIITNPPYSLAMDFAVKSVELLNPGGHLVLLTRLNWLASQKRATWLRANTPSVYVLPKRPSFTGGGTDATDYAWLMWRKPMRANERHTPIVHILEIEP